MLTTEKERQLKNLGLNSYEAKVWTALLIRGVSTAGELSDMANVPRSRSYDVLESLERKGFVISKLGKPITYIAVSPNKAVEKAKKIIQESAKEQYNKLNNLKEQEIIKELNNLHTQGVELVRSLDLSASLRGKQNLYNHFWCMLKKAKKYVLISTTPKELISLVEQFKPLFQKLKKKNVNTKISTQINKQTKKYVDEIKQFAEVKHTDNKARFCIIDGKEIIFMVFDDNEVHPTYDVGIWVNIPLAKDLERVYLSDFETN